MTTESRLRMQARVVRVIYRAELARLRHLDATLASRRERLTALRSRCMVLIQTVRAELDGDAAWHPDLLAELDDLDNELSGPMERLLPGP